MRLISLIIALNLTGFVFGAEGNIDQGILKSLRDNDASLTILGLNSNQIGNAGASALADALRVNTSLTELNLYNNQIGDAGATALADALKLNTSLTTLNLNSNQIGDDGASALADALKTNTNLTILSLYSNQIGDALQEIRRLMIPPNLQVPYYGRGALVPWSIPRHLELAIWNLHVIPVAKTICLIELRSGKDGFQLPKLPIEMWWEILKCLNCGNFGPLALPAP